MAIKYPTNPLKFGLARNFIHRYQCRLQGLDQSQRYLRIREKVRERGSESFTVSHYVTFPFLDPLSLSHYVNPEIHNVIEKAHVLF